MILTIKKMHICGHISCGTNRTTGSTKKKKSITPMNKPLVGFKYEQKGHMQGQAAESKQQPEDSTKVTH